MNNIKTKKPTEKTNRLQQDNIELLVQQGEGYNLEFKEGLSDNIGRTMCAFANASGGRILIGINDKGGLTGFKPTNKAKSEIYDIARKMEPSIRVSVDKTGENICVITVFEGIEKPYSFGGKFFMREGSNSQQLSRDEIRTFFQKEGKVLFDEMPNADFNMAKDFDITRYRRFLQKTGISKIVDKIRVLENLGLLKAGFLRNAGVLLFSKNILKCFSHTGINCCIFQGQSKAVILDQKICEDDVFTNYENAVLYLRKNLRTRYIIDDAGPRKEALEIPEDVLREAVLNAIVHRDYFERGAAVTVEIYSDRVEISNPGELAAGLKPEDFGKKSVSRNPLLFGLFHRMGAVEKIGSGIKRMRAAMEQAGLKEPEFEITGFFTIKLFRSVLKSGEKVTAEFTPETAQKLPGNRPETAQKIIDAIKLNPAVTRKKLALQTGFTEDTVKHTVSKLKKQNVLKRIGSDREGYWEIHE